MSTLLTVTRPMTEWRLAAEHEEAEQWSCHQSRDTATGHQAAASTSAVLQCCSVLLANHITSHIMQPLLRPDLSPPTVHAGTVRYLNVIFCFGKTRK